MRIDLVREQCVDIVGDHCIFDGMILYLPHNLSAENVGFIRLNGMIFTICSVETCGEAQNHRN